MNTIAPGDSPIIIMTRHFHAPRELVWSTLTDPRHVAVWFGGHGFANPVCEMDVRPGGRWRHTMRTPDGSEYSMEYTFLEVVPPERLAWQDEERSMTVTLEDAGAQTRWKLVTRFPSIAARDAAMQRGFTETLSQGCEKLDAIAIARSQAPLYDLARGTYVGMLHTLDALVAKATDEQLGARLAPDMFTLAQQVRLACHYALEGMLGLAGRTWPTIDVTADATVAAARARIASTIAAVEEVPRDAFVGAEDREVVIPLDKVELRLPGARILRDWALPHFYFHVATAYDILRHVGVPIGKRDWITRVADGIRQSP